MKNTHAKNKKVMSNDRFKAVVDCPKTSSIIRKTLELCFRSCAECDNCDVLAKAMSAQGIGLDEARAYREQVDSSREPANTEPRHGETVDKEEEGRRVLAEETQPPRRKLKTKKGGLRKRGRPLGLKARSGEGPNQQPLAADTQKTEAEEEQPRAEEGKTKPPPPKAVCPVLVGHKTVPVDAINLDKSLYPRAAMIEENIERLRGLDGCFKDKIVVSEDMILVDGGHRVEALRRDRTTEVEVLVYKYDSPGSLLRHAVQLNCEHGYQLST